MKFQVVYISIAISLLTAVQSAQARPIGDDEVGTSLNKATKEVGGVDSTTLDDLRRRADDDAALPSDQRTGLQHAHAGFNKRQQDDGDRAIDNTPGHAPAGGNMAGSITQGVEHALGKRQADLGAVTSLLGGGGTPPPADDGSEPEGGFAKR
ncbi:unnamed protein product [Absidia cylindrospora]